MDLYGKNINLQNEIDSFLFGSGTEAPKGRDIIYRRIRKDSNDSPIECECVSNTTGEADKDTFCPYCLGSRYYWDEEFITSYWHRPGSDGNLVFYFSYDINPSTIDELILVGFDSDGNTITPIERIKLYNILSIDILREERGLLSFYKIIAAPVNRRYIGPK